MSDKEEAPPAKEGSPKKEETNGVTRAKSRSRSYSSSRSGSHHSNSRSASRSRSKSGSGSDKSASRSRSRSRSSRDRSRSRSHSKSHSRSHGKKVSESRSRRRSSSRSRSHSPRHKRRSSYRSRSRSPPAKRSYYGNRRNDTRDNPEPSRCLGVFGLSLYTTERDLRNMFEKFSEVESIQIVYDHQTGRSRGYAFVYFPNEKHATTCKENTNGQELDGRQIRVDYSITKNPHNPTPGMYMGKPSQFSRKPYRGGGTSSSSRYDSRDSYSSRSNSRRSRSRSRSYSPRRDRY